MFRNIEGFYLFSLYKNIYMMKPYKLILFASLCLGLICQDIKAQVFSFSFDGRDKSAVQISSSDVYTDEIGYGYDFIDVIDTAKKSQTPSYFIGDKINYFSVNIPDGNYKVTIEIGSKKNPSNTTVRAESRRLFINNASTKKGEFQTYSFVVNKRNTSIITSDGKRDVVRIKKREEKKLNWDDKLTFEFNGDKPAISSLKIEPADSAVTTLWLCGNSTVVDQDYEPWASWGQMMPFWFTDKVCIANYAESGETATSFIAANRLKKISSLMKPGDFLFVEFGHNDQKEKKSGSGAFYNFVYALKQFVDEARSKGVTPVFVTPTQRRMFDSNNKIMETHSNYPDAMRWVAKDLNVPVIELHDMTRTFFETLGVEGSKNSLVHYPSGSFPGQSKAFEDNTHFNPYGAYEISKMVVEGIKDLKLPITEYLKPTVGNYNPSQPDDWKSFKWHNSPFIEIDKPDGN